MERDVVIVGAGPTGAVAAANLALKGHDVLLLDRQSFPRDKTCGDAVPGICIEWLWELGMKERIAAAAERGDFREVRSMKLVSPHGRILERRFALSPKGAESYIAPRVAFDNEILNGAIDAGAEFKQAHVRDVTFDLEKRVNGVRVNIEDKVLDIRAKIVIGADGVGSIVARKLRARDGLHEDQHRAVALRAYVDGFDEQPYQIEFYLLKEILPGYAWIFPLGNGRANIGLGLRLDVLRQRKLNLREMIHRFVNIPMISDRLSPDSNLQDIATWPLNFGSQRNLQSAFDGAVLIGDAAGYIDPLTGGGFKNSFESAKIAGNVIHDALEKGDTSRSQLMEYQRKFHQLTNRELRYSHLIQRALLRFPTASELIVGGLAGSRLISSIFIRNM